SSSCPVSGTRPSLRTHRGPPTCSWPSPRPTPRGRAAQDDHPIEGNKEGKGTRGWPGGGSHAPGRTCQGHLTPSSRRSATPKAKKVGAHSPMKIPHRSARSVPPSSFYLDTHQLKRAIPTLAVPAA